MTFESNNTSVSEFGQLATPTVIARAQILHFSRPVFVFLGEKPKKFNGLNCKRWQKNMLFYLTTLNLERFFTEDALKLKEDERDI